VLASNELPTSGRDACGHSISASSTLILQTLPCDLRLLLISAHPIVIFVPLIRLAGQVEVRKHAVDVGRHDLARRANVGLVELVIAGYTKQR
jgi:hypothetical protein